MLITEGSGVNAKYYIQVGADTASKKLLGSNVVFDKTQILRESTLTYTATCNKFLVFATQGSNNTSRGTVSVTSEKMKVTQYHNNFDINPLGGGARVAWASYLVEGDTGQSIRISLDGSYGVGGFTIFKLN